jgi:dTMP kinase
MLPRAMFVTFEGLDGSGKTTQVELLKKHLEREGREVVTTREPGGTEVGEHIRNVVLHLDHPVVPWAEAALFAAARAQLVAEVIRPALERGTVVLCDRYVDSSLAYQGIARGLGVDPVLELNLRATGDLLPDRTFLLLVDPEESRRRGGDTRDRIEREDDEFVRKVDRAYRELAELFPSRILAVDGALDPAELAETIRGQLRDVS